MTKRTAARVRVLLTIACVAIATWAPPALAQDDRPIEWTFGNEEGGPLLLDGYRPVEAFTFDIPAGWDIVDEAVLTLNTVGTPELAPGAGLTFTVNGVPVHSVALAPDEAEHEVAIPPELVLPGANEVELDVILPLVTDEECIDPSHPGRWLLVTGTPTLTATFRPSEQLTIRDFPHAFVPLGTPESPITIVIPDAPDADALSAAAGVVYATAQAGVETEWQVTRKRDVTAEDLEGRTVVIGGDVPEGATPGAEGSAFLTRSTSGEPGLTLVAAPEGSLSAVADALADPLTIVPLEGGELDVAIGPARAPRTPRDSFRLSDIGYGERGVTGLGELSLIYRFDVPFEWEPMDGALASRLIADPGNIAVALNGRNITNLRIFPGEGDTRVDDLVVPMDLIRPGRNFLRFTFDLEDPSDCRTSATRPSGTVSADTRLELPHRRNGGRLELADFPYVFASEPDMTLLTIVIPDEPTVGEITSGLRIVEALGASDSRFAPRLVTTRDVEQSIRSGHMIVVGEPERQRLIGELNRDLPLRLDNAGRPLESADLEIAGQAVGPATVQVLESPWVEHKLILVVTGPTPSSVETAVAAAVGDEQAGGLAGQAVLVGAPDRRGSIAVLTLGERELEADSVSFVDRVPTPVRIVLLVVIAIAAAAASTLFRRTPIRIGRKPKAASGGH